ncbi:MAG: peptide MFS transporter [Paludibacteraceae bacterium]|nr:peptide MFS transporter [Paludibacteraceae bacterium]
MTENFKHPNGLYLLFTVEMWERFSYYGMRALLIFYLTKSFMDGGLAISESNASLIYGIFTGLVYFTPLIGGWIADRFIGQRLSIEIGAFMMMAGQFCLASEQDATMLFIGLTLLIIGNGFFKPNISVIVGQLYAPQDRRRDSAFTIFYMGINIGALFAPLVTGALAETYNYRAGFLAAGIGLLIGLIAYKALGNKMLGDHGKRPKIESADASPNEPLTKTEKDRTISIFIITFFVIFFFAGFEQAGSSLSLYADKFIDRSIGSWEMPASWFQSINPLFIVILAPLFSAMWRALNRRSKEPSVVVKMGSGMILLGLGFLFMVGAVSQRGGSEDISVKASIWWMVLTYLTHTVGELCLSPIGLSMVSRLAPVKLASLLMGVWLMSSFFANILGGVIASKVGDVGALEIFGGIAGVCILLGLIMFCVNKKLTSMMHLDEF